MARSGSIQYRRVEFANIVRSISSFGLGHRVIDETGLQGNYDIDLQWTPGDRRSFAAALEASGLQCKEKEEVRKVRKLHLTGPAAK